MLLWNQENTAIQFGVNNAEQMRLTSTGLGIGTSSPSEKLEVVGNYIKVTGTTNQVALRAANTGGDIYFGLDNSAGNNFNTGTAYAGVVWRSGANPICFVNNNSEKMRLDSSGNLGLGVTPSAWGGGYTGLQVRNSFSIWAATGTSAYLSRNVFYDGTSRKYVFTGAAAEYELGAGTHTWYTAPSGTAGNAISFTQAMTLDASGRLGVGRVPTTYGLEVVGGINAAFSSGNRTGVLLTGDSGDGRVVMIAGDATERCSIRAVDAGGPASMLFFTNNAAATNTERMRIDSSGNLLVGTTSPVGVARLTISGGSIVANAPTSTSTGTYSLNDNGSSPNTIRFYNNTDSNNTTNRFVICDAGASVLRAEIRSNGGIANYSANDVNLSDRREKTNFAPAKSYLDTICAIPVQTFNYIDQNNEADPGLTLGVVAQDVQAVAPELVMESNWGSKDDPKMRLSIYQTDLQYALMKALQELKAEFDAYKSTHP
jgi:hypothetical protein